MARALFVVLYSHYSTGMAALNVHMGRERDILPLSEEFNMKMGDVLGYLLKF
ncbi:hypothetical protein [Methanoregula sp.]|uniref:hypothetical protein n=1 Tax=Methanoregula sp. TaxID=2052170 RepID=UPI0035679F10